MNTYNNRSRGPNSSTKRAKVNHQISAREVRLIDAEGQQVGIVGIQEALNQAEAATLDLVEIAPQLTPPVCRIMDFGKYVFEQRKRLKQKSKRVQVKELKMRPVTDVGDYLVKIKKAIAFLEEGDKVKLVVRFRGRELSYQQQGVDILRRAENDLKDCGTVEQSPKMEGKQMVMLIVPGKK
ncbi:MAG: translation initiation factor IF-3 [Gammaproteobacteria bacterium]|nr:translation initiation factor IF-3 [Gammaproteobacteria bacterium]